MVWCGKPHRRATTASKEFVAIHGPPRENALRSAISLDTSVWFDRSVSSAFPLHFDSYDYLTADQNWQHPQPSRDRLKFEVQEEADPPPIRFPAEGLVSPPANSGALHAPETSVAEWAGQVSLVFLKVSPTGGQVAARLISGVLRDCRIVVEVPISCTFPIVGRSGYSGMSDSTAAWFKQMNASAIWLRRRLSPTLRFVGLCGRYGTGYLWFKICKKIVYGESEGAPRSWIGR